MFRHTESPTLVYYTDDDVFKESLIEHIASFLHWRPFKADCIWDLVACNQKASIVERSSIEPAIYQYLHDVYLTPTATALMEMEPDYDWSFKEKWFVFGTGPDIPQEFKQFFIEIGRLNPERILQQLKLL